jgi:hypothetical protein
MPLDELLGVRLDEVAKSPFALALGRRGEAEMIHDRLHVTYPDSGMEFGAHIDGRVASIFLYLVRVGRVGRKRGGKKSAMWE